MRASVEAFYHIESTRSVVRFSVHFAVKHDDCVRRNDRVASMLASDMLRLCFCEFFDEPKTGKRDFISLSSIFAGLTSYFTPISARISLRRGEDEARITLFENLFISCRFRLDFLIFRFGICNHYSDYRISRFLPYAALNSAAAPIASLTSSAQSPPFSHSVLTITLSPKTSR